MKIIKAIFIYILLFISLLSWSQNDVKSIPHSRYISTNSDSFLISSKPVTNREYIMYLIWNMIVYGADYPKVVWELVPGELSIDTISIKGIYGLGERINYYLDHTDPFVKNYIFNPNYLDYPVIGLSWYQASKMNKWLSDRYNETKLIRYKILKNNINQISEDCFVTESYVFGQYFGLRKKYIDLNTTFSWYDWNEKILLPSFRLPTHLELDLTKKNGLIDQGIKPYMSNKKHFLEYWYGIFMTEFKGDLYVMDPFWGAEYIKIGDKNREWDINRFKYEEMVLNIDSSSFGMKPLDVYIKNGQPIRDFQYKNNMEIKDSLGMLPIIIIDEDNKQQPICIETYNKISHPKPATNRFYYFRFSCSAKQGQYRP